MTFRSLTYSIQLIVEFPVFLYRHQARFFNKLIYIPKANLFIAHNAGEERTYANIETILPANGKGAEKHSLTPSQDYVRVIDREGYKEPAESFPESSYGVTV